MIKLILFDWGDVCGLYNLKIFNNSLKKAGYSIEISTNHFEKLKAQFDRDSISEKEFWSKLAEKLKFRGNWSTLVLNNRKNLIINWPLLHYIQKIKNKVHVALLSNMDKSSIRGIKNKIKLNDYFEKIYFSSEYKVGKLEKTMINKVLTDFKIKPKEILFIDDFSGNIEKAKTFDMQTLLFVNVKDLKLKLDRLLSLSKS